jgi:nicotinate-nucleotide adenylyltransferase
MSPEASKSRVAFFGGSFDPPHLGHLAVARAAREGLGLDTVLFVPVGAQPLKPDGATAPYEDRLAMTQLAIAGESGFGISLADAPMNAGAPNYTAETLERLREDLGPGCDLYCLMGADSLAGLRLWHRAAEIPFIATLIVASRPGEDLDNLRALLPAGLAMEAGVGVSGLPVSDVEVKCFSLLAEGGRWAGKQVPLYLLPGVDVPISASRIRELVGIQALEHVGVDGANEGGEALNEMLPEAVAEYVRAHGLYR